MSANEIIKPINFNPNLCLFICKNNRQCKNRPDGDIFAQGRCYRHRVIKRDIRTREQIREDWTQQDINEEMYGKIPKTSDEILREKILKHHWDKFFKNLYSKYLPKKDPHIPIDVQILKDRVISTKTEWKKWLVYNHPDKGGEESIFINVLIAGRKIYN